MKLSDGITLTAFFFLITSIWQAFFLQATSQTGNNKICFQCIHRYLQYLWIMIAKPQGFPSLNLLSHSLQPFLCR